MSGAGLRQERLSTREGFCCPDKSNWFLNVTELNETVISRGAADQIINAGSGYWACEDGTCGSCAISILSMKERYNATYNDLIDEYLTLGADFGSTKLDRSLTRLSCHSTEQVKLISFKFPPIFSKTSLT